MSNSTTKKKSINFKQCDKSDILIGKNKILINTHINI